MKSVFLTMMQAHIYMRRYTKRTIEFYLRWIAAFIRCDRMPHQNTLGNADVELFISHLTNQQHVAQNIQAQALDVLGNPLKIF